MPPVAHIPKSEQAEVNPVEPDRLSLVALAASCCRFTAHAVAGPAHL